MKREHEVSGEFADYRIVEERDEDGFVRIAFYMDPPPGQYGTEIWSWTGRRVCQDAARGGTRALRPRHP